VLAAAQTLGYRPAGYSAIPALSRRKRVGVVMANLFSPYFCHLYSMFESELELREFDIIWRVVSDLSQLDAQVAGLIPQDVDGIIVLSAVPGAQVRKKVVAANIALVVLDRQEQAEGAALVWIDGPEIGRAVAQMMLKEGRKRPAAIAANPRRLTELHGFAEAMEAAGSAPCLWLDTGWTYENGVTTAQRLLAGDDMPDAIFCASDYLAVGIVDVLRAQGSLRVPEDVSVVGFGDTSQSRWLSHQTTSIQLPLLALVQTAVATVASRMGPATSQPPRIWLGCDIVERGTTLGLSHPESGARTLPSAE